MWTVLGSLGTKLVAYWAANSSKVIVMGVVTVTTLGIIGYGYYKIDQGGYNRADLEWKEREAKVNSQQDALLKQRQKEHDLALKQNSDMYIEAIRQYEKNNETLKRDLADSHNKRLFIRATCPKGSGSAMPSDAKVSGRDLQAGDGDNWAGLAEEDSIAIQDTAAYAKQMSMQYRLLLEKMNEAGMFE